MNRQFRYTRDWVKTFINCESTFARRHRHCVRNVQNWNLLFPFTFKSMLRLISALKVMQLVLIVYAEVLKLSHQYIIILRAIMQTLSNITMQAKFSLVVTHTLGISTHLNVCLNIFKSSLTTSILSLTDLVLVQFDIN